MTLSPRTRRRAWILNMIFGWAVVLLLVGGLVFDLIDHTPGTRHVVAAVMEGLAIIALIGAWIGLNRLLRVNYELTRVLSDAEVGDHLLRRILTGRLHTDGNSPKGVSSHRHR